ncbi:MAG: diguanylate cyclase [bacterium]|nr:diguanylate cyclase [bacterium]
MYDRDGKKDSVLIVYSKDKMATDISSALEGVISIVRARNVVEALSSMTFHVPSLIISDIDLPGISGIYLIKNIRKNIKTRLIPFIIITSIDQIKERIESIEAGADAYIVYPFVPEELAAVVKSKLEKYKEFYLLSITDELTRLFNRREFIKKINDQVSFHPHDVISLAILDIDFFKKVNDVYGHQVGDTVLMRLAEILKSRISQAFFPARFGGEEFVILLIGMDIEASKIEMEDMLDEFAAVMFKTKKSNFRVTFSVGVAEYPTMALNASELLSRADQALYSAKRDGRNRVYTFSPIMSRNDKFWEYLRLKNKIFVDDKSHDTITNLPYLPHLLEIISSLDFEVRNLGILIIKLHPVYEISNYLSSNNYSYDIENIKILIAKTAESVFPSDMFIGLLDFFNYEFIITFPSPVDFSFNLEKFNQICKEICQAINKGIGGFNMEISYSSNVVSFDRANPRQIFSDINNIKKTKKIPGKKRKFSKFLTAFEKITNGADLKKYLIVKSFRNLETYKSEFLYLSLLDPFGQSNILGALLESSIGDIKTFVLFLELLNSSFRDEMTGPFLLDWIPSIEFSEYLKAVQKAFQGREVVILIDEQHLSMINESRLIPVVNKLPENITLGVDNCYIGNEILGFLSLLDFKLLLFSENITRELHLFKDRIKVISGLKIFLDQLGILAIAKNIEQEEEFQVIKDLNITYASGTHVEELLLEDPEIVV